MAKRKVKTEAENSDSFRNRVVERRRILGAELSPNGRNWRQHPTGQIDEPKFCDVILRRAEAEGLTCEKEETACV